MFSTTKELSLKSNNTIEVLTLTRSFLLLVTLKLKKMIKQIDITSSMKHRVNLRIYLTSFTNMQLPKISYKVLQTRKS